MISQGMYYYHVIVKISKLKLKSAYSVANASELLSGELRFNTNNFTQKPMVWPLQNKKFHA